MYNVVEFFSGIGSQAKALRNLGQEVDTVGTSEWDIHAIIAYDLIHNGPKIPDDILTMGKSALLDILKQYTFSNTGKTVLAYESLKTYSELTLQRIYTSIRRNNNFVDIASISGADLPDNIDILTYSFPCQDLSNVGAFHGYNKGIDKDSGSRSSLLWQVGRILQEAKDENRKLPRFLLMENVPSLLSKRHLANFSIWINDLKNLGYISKYYQLNASSFGLPQNRPRLLMISVYVGNEDYKRQLVLDYFRDKSEVDVINDYMESGFFCQHAVKDFLRINYSNRELFDEAVECCPNNTISRQKIWDENPQILLPDGNLNPEILTVRTITTKQDRNPNSGNLWFDSRIPGRAAFRYLTPRECLLFMGFTDKDFEALKKNNLEFHKGDALFARDKVIRLAGNSIPVKLLEGVFLQILQIDSMLKEYSERIKEIESHPELAKTIRSELYDRNLRSRTAKYEYPETADIIYPKYKSAIYICDCFFHGHNCINSSLPEDNQLAWRDVTTTTSRKREQECRVATEMGWNAIRLWKCGLFKGNADLIMDQLAEKIKSNANSTAENGEVISIG